MSERDERKVLEPYHDRIRETVEQRFAGDDAHREDVHWRLGRALLAAWPDADARGSRIFSIVNNLTRAPGRFVDAGSRLELCRLTHEAASRAMSATGYERALAYARAALALLPDDRGEEGRALSFELSIVEMHAAYLAGQHDAARALFPLLAARAERARDIGRVYELKLALEQSGGAHALATEAGIEGLARLGHALGRNPSKLRVLYEVTRARRVLRPYSGADLLALPAIDDERAEAVLRILAAVVPAALRCNANLMTVAIVRCLRLTLVHGLSMYADRAFVFFALVLCGAFNGHERARELFDVAVALRERYGHVSGPADVTDLGIAGYMRPWFVPVRECVPELEAAYLRGVRSGDGLGPYGCLIMKPPLLMWIGSDLAEAHAAAERAARENGRRRIRDWELVALVQVGCAQALRGECDPLDALDAIREQVEAQDNLAAFTYFFSSCILHYHLGDSRDALAAATGAHRLRHHVFGSWNALYCSFFGALVASQAAHTAPTLARRRLRARVRREVRTYRRLRGVSEANFLPGTLLLEAELAALSAAPDVTRQRYDEAIACAAQHDSRHVLAMAQENYGHFLHRLDDAEWRAQLNTACETYRSWGANAVADRIEQRFASETSP